MEDFNKVVGKSLKGEGIIYIIIIIYQEGDSEEIYYMHFYHIMITAIHFW